VEASFLQRAGRGFYLAWVPLTILLIALLALPGSLGWAESAVVAVPACAAYAFVCRSSQYLCRVLPLRRSSVARLVATYALTAGTASGLFLGLTRLIAKAAAASGALENLGARLDGQLPLLLATGVTYYLLSVAFHYVLLALAAAQEAEERAAEARVLAREAALRALKAQVNPHFLFNSLHSISALTGVDGGRAREMCILLADFLRASLGLGSRTTIPLREELALAKKYLAVEQVRFADRMTLREEIAGEALDCALPALLLQPLVENAVKHGVATVAHDGRIDMRAALRGNRLEISIENNFDPDAPPRSRSGLGLQNVKNRLHARYGEAASLETRAGEDRFRVELRLPAETVDQAGEAV
jgi:hypothetical protein